MRDPVELLAALVAIDSVSSRSNRPVVELVKNELSPAGWLCREHPYLDDTGVEKVNLIAWAGGYSAPDGRAELALVCHTDTVPYSPDWREATTLLAQGEDLKGCGACDVKGFLAAMLAAGNSLDCASLRRPLCMVFTADEEIGCIGARHLLESRALSPRFALIGEPTSLRAVRAGKGYCLAEVHVMGREAHSAYPERGVSAIYKAARLIVEIERLAERLKEETDDRFSPAWTTLNVGEIKGGLAKNIVAPSCSFLLEWRPIPGQSADLVPELVHQAIADLSRSDPDLRCELVLKRVQEGFSTAKDSPLLRAVQAAAGREPATVAFGTEAPWMVKMGAEAIVMGPGSMHSAHSPREFVPRSELHETARILREVIQRICG